MTSHSFKERIKKLVKPISYLNYWSFAIFPYINIVGAVLQTFIYYFLSCFALDLPPLQLIYFQAEPPKPEGLIYLSNAALLKIWQQYTQILVSLCNANKVLSLHQAREVGYFEYLFRQSFSLITATQGGPTRGCHTMNYVQPSLLQSKLNKSKVM